MSPRAERRGRLAALLRERREELGFSILGTAGRARLAPAEVEAAELEEGRGPSKRTVAALARVYGLGPDELAAVNAG